MELNFTRPAEGAVCTGDPAAVRRMERGEPKCAEPKRAAAPVVDRYVPEERQPSAGLYRIGRGEDGKPRVYFDDPEAAPEEPSGQERTPKAEGPERRKSSEKTTADTDRVDREIEKLKKERERLVQQLRAETDETRARELERKLAQVEDALRQKDNDAYRRQHTVFS